MKYMHFVSEASKYAKYRSLMPTEVEPNPKPLEKRA